MKNKRVKQMIADVVMQQRKVYWYGEQSEIFLAPSADAIKQEFLQDFHDDELECELIAADWRYMWQPALHERETSEPYKGAKVYNKKGELLPWYEKLPLIAGMRGDKDKVTQLSSSYN